MAFDVPNESQAAHGEQSTLFSTDLDALVQGLNREGVISGCEVAAQDPEAMAVDVAEGVGHIGGSDVNVAAGSVNITAADATRLRVDIIVANNAGAKSAVDGTWDEDDNPIMPAIPANSVVLAAIYVPAAATTIGSSEIIDKRVMLGALQEGDIPADIARDAEVAEAIGTHAGDDDAHHTPYTDEAADVRVAAGIATHAEDDDAHHARYTDAEVDAIVATHTAISDAHHSRYTDAEVDAIVATHAAIAAAHHARYTDGEADARVAAGIAAHAAAADPHTGYQKESEKNAANGYAGLDAASKLTVAQIRGLRESGGQALDMSEVADGEYLKRSGTTIVGDTPAGGGSVATDEIWDAAGDLAVGTGADAAAKLTKGTSGKMVRAGASTLSWEWDEAGIEFVIDGGGGVISTGLAGGLEVPFNCFVTGWTITAVDGNTGAIVVDVWKDTYANFPPTVADTIAGSEKPTIAATGNKGQDLSLSTWTQALTKGDWLFFNVDSVATLTRVTVSLRVDKYRTS